VEPSSFDEVEFFSALEASGARALLILTKQVNSRPKDLEDIRLLRILKDQLA
jgi:hypothetical protein